MRLAISLQNSPSPERNICALICLQLREGERRIGTVVRSDIRKGARCNAHSSAEHLRARGACLPLQMMAVFPFSM